MSNLKSIFVFVLCVIIFAETIGMQIIKDMCLPCKGETVALHIPFTKYETECCHGLSKKIDSCNESHCCNKDKHGDLDHEHKKEIKVISRNPEFRETVEQLQIKFIAMLIAIVNNESAIGLLTGNVNKVCLVESDFLSPNFNIHSLFCVFII